MTPTGPRGQAQPPQPAQVTQEQVIYAQAKANVQVLGPRVRMLTECVREMEDAAHTATAHIERAQYIQAMSVLLQAVSSVQLTQLKAALDEGERDMAKCQQVIQQIENPVKIFRPAGFTPQGA